MCSNYEHLISGEIVSAIYYDGTRESAESLRSFINLETTITVGVWINIFDTIEVKLDDISCTFDKICINITYRNRTKSDHRVYNGDYFVKNAEGNSFETYESINFFQHYRKIL